MPLELEELRIALWNRFGGLHKNLEDPKALILLAELPRPAGVSDDSLEEYLMTLTSTEDLVSFIQQS